jgi:hypothetical protein
MLRKYFNKQVHFLQTENFIWRTDLCETMKLYSASFYVQQIHDKRKTLNFPTLVLSLCFKQVYDRMHRPPLWDIRNFHNIPLN